MFPSGEGAQFAISICDEVKERTANYNDAEFLVDLVTEVGASLPLVSCMYGSCACCIVIY